MKLATHIGALPASVLATSASPDLSARYKYISSADIISIMENEGFTLHEVQTPRAARKRDPLYAIHQLDFRHPDFKALEDGSVPRILFKNSHDGTSTASFMMGVYRFICSNGMVVGSTYAREVVRHSGEQAASLIQRVRELSKNTAPLFGQIEQWTKKSLSASEVREFARLAAVLRFGDAQRFDPEQLVLTQRPEDEGDTLWRVFNRVQENATRGGLVGYSATGHQLASRPLKAIEANTRFNADLWRLAEEFAE